MSSPAAPRKPMAELTEDEFLEDLVRVPFVRSFVSLRTPAHVTILYKKLASDIDDSFNICVSLGNLPQTVQPLFSPRPSRC